MSYHFTNLFTNFFLCKIEEKISIEEKFKFVLEFDLELFTSLSLSFSFVIDINL